jgi:hypothetical protein
MKRYFETLAGRIKSIPSALVWNTDETSVECPKKALNTEPGSVTISEVRDDAQLTLRTAISAFGDSIYLFFISKLKTFDKTLPTAQKPHESHIYSFRPAHWGTRGDIRL